MAFEGSMDRRELARQSTPKETKWPRTERRRRRIEEVLRRRQRDLTVVLENVHDPHNVSAVLRSCDAVGIGRVHVVYSVESPPERAYARTTSASAAKWIDIMHHESIAACYEVLRRDGFAVVAATLGKESIDLYEVDFRRPIAVVFGNEMRGLSDEAREQADVTVTIPMMGMVQSLNISVACAVTLYEALRQRLLAGNYEEPTFDATTLTAMIDDWLAR
jgi:tRNA (guanosine-2'-O-)-methyltransferase